VPIFLALAASVVYGAADFLGGLASRRAATFPVAAIVQIVGLIALVIATPLFSSASPSLHSLAWGGAGGATGALGLALLYSALAKGRMSVVAPLTAVCAITVPVITGLFLGERLSPPVLAGVALAMGAIVLISQEGERHAAAPALPGPRRRIDASIGYALGSGVAIGGFYVSLERAGSGAGLWPLLAARVVSVSGFALIALVSGRSFRLPRASLRTVLAAGMLDVLANALYLLAVREGMLSIVATLSSLYPASTVLLAYLLLGERLRWVQIAGLGVATVAVVMIAG
jgi:uncharacterized membrane protein